MQPADVFDQLPLFIGLDPDQIDLLRSLFVPFDCFAGTVLFKQGDLAENVFVLIDGEVVTQYKPHDSPPITVSRIKVGGVVGWSAAFGRRRYSSAAICTNDCQLLRIRGKDLQALTRQQPELVSLLLERMAASIAERCPDARAQVVALLENSIRNGSPLKEME
jgi:CRP-like cAMP-binding protein